MPPFDDLPVAVMIDELPSPTDAAKDGRVGAEAAPEAAPVAAPEPPAEPEPEAQVDAAPTVDVREEQGTGEAGDGDAAGVVDVPPPSGAEGTPARAAADAEAEVFEEPSAPEPASAPPSAPEAEEDLWVDPQPEPEPRVKRPSRPARPGELPERRVVVIDEEQDLDIKAGQEQPPRAPSSPEEGSGMAEIGATLEEDSGKKRRWRMFRKGGER
jgi:hypothetical protein